MYLARRGRGAAVLSTALNSNAINVVAGLLIPACLAGLGPRSGPGTLVAAWYAGLTVLALALAFRGRGLGRASGAAIIAGYLAFVTALVITVEQGTRPPGHGRNPGRHDHRGRRAAAHLAAAGRGARPGRPMAAGVGAARMEHRPPVAAQPHLLCGVIAACDAASGPHLILIGLLVIGPACALLTARWTLTAAASCLAVALGVALGVPDQIFATVTQYVFLAAVAAVGTTATAGAAVLQHQRSLIAAG